MARTQKKFAILFPGGGAQHPGMGKFLYLNFQTSKDVFAEVEDALHEPVTDWCFNNTRDELSEMRKSLIAIFTCSLAGFRVLAERVGTPDFLAGHSLGEFTALAASETLSLREAAGLVSKRAALLETAGGRDVGMMAINKVKVETVEAACRTVAEQGARVFVSVLNSALQNVVSGDMPGLHSLKKEIEQYGGECTILNIRTPSHCPLLGEAAAEFGEMVARCTFRDPAVPVVSNLTGLPYAAATPWQDVLSRHMVQPVQWFASMKFLLRSDVQRVIDAGPQSILTQLMRHIDQGVDLYACNGPDDIRKIENEFKKASSVEEDFVKFCLVAAVSTKNHNAALSADAGSHYEQLRDILQAIRRGKPPAGFPGVAASVTMDILKEKQCAREDLDYFLSAVKNDFKELGIHVTEPHETD